MRVTYPIILILLNMIILIAFIGIVKIYEGLVIFYGGGTKFYIHTIHNAKLYFCVFIFIFLLADKRFWTSKQKAFSEFNALFVVLLPLISNTWTLSHFGMINDPPFHHILFDLITWIILKTFDVM